MHTITIRYQDLLQESDFPIQPEKMYPGATLPIANNLRLSTLVSQGTMWGHPVDTQSIAAKKA